MGAAAGHTQRESSRADSEFTLSVTGTLKHTYALSNLIF